MYSNIRMGTRNSPMAIAVAEYAKVLINRSNDSVLIDISSYTSDGDRITGSLADFGGKGTFVKDLEKRLLNNEIDCAIHALKDIPGDVQMHDALMLIAFLPREDARDALVLRSGISEERLLLDDGLIIGTSAPRRQAALARLYPKVTFQLSRGNVNTRIQKLDSGQYDALVLSGAGLERVGLGNRISRLFDKNEILPAIGQGILCLQIRKSDQERYSFLRSINNSWSENAAKAERTILFELKGNCHSAIAAHCSLNGDNIELCSTVFAAKHDDNISVVVSSEIKDCDFYGLGVRAAAALISKGANALL